MQSAFAAPDANLLLAERATEANVRRLELRADIFVFATHGLLASDPQGSGEPGLVLTPPNLATQFDDGFLSMTEIAALEIDADWVVVSACNTAASDGSMSQGGLSGIALAFFFAGARNLLASHWPVHDDAAAELTVRTVQYLQSDAGLSRAEAFQHAMRSLRNDNASDGWAHPAAWAPFTLIGDGASMANR